MEKEQAERLALINENMRAIAVILSKSVEREMRMSQGQLDKLVGDIREIRELLTKNERGMAMDEQYSREELYMIGKIIGRMDTIHYILMRSQSKNIGGRWQSGTER